MSGIKKGVPCEEIDSYESYYENFKKVERRITMSKEDFIKDWSQVTEKDRIPSLVVKDDYSSISLNEAKDQFASFEDTKGHEYEILNNRLMKKVKQT